MTQFIVLILLEGAIYMAIGGLVCKFIDKVFKPEKKMYNPEEITRDLLERNEELIAKIQQMTNP